MIDPACSPVAAGVGDDGRVDVFESPNESFTTSGIGTPAQTSSQAQRSMWIGSGAMVVSNGLTLACTFVFWAVVNRSMDTQGAARAAAVLAAVNLAGGVAQANLQAVFQRVLPAHSDPRRFAARGYVAAAVAATVLALGVLVAAATAVGSLRFVTDDPALSAMVVAGAVATALFAIQDGVLSAMRRFGAVPASNAAASVARVGLVAVLHASPLQVVAAWLVPVALGTLVMSSAAFWRWLPGFAGHPEARRDVPRQYLGAEVVGWVLVTSCQWVLPLAVLARHGEAVSQVFYLCITIAISLGALGSAVTGGLTVAAAHQPDQFPTLIRRAGVVTGAGIGVISVTLVVLAPVVMRLYGVERAALGVDLLRIVAVASLVRVIGTLGVASARAHLATADTAGLQVAHAVGTFGTFALVSSLTGGAWAWFGGQVVAALYVVWRWRAWR